MIIDKYTNAYLKCTYIEIDSILIDKQMDGWMDRSKSENSMLSNAAKNFPRFATRPVPWISDSFLWETGG